jgi:hypothetical protein
VPHPCPAPSYLPSARQPTTIPLVRTRCQYIVSLEINTTFPFRRYRLTGTLGDTRTLTCIRSRLARKTQTYPPLQVVREGA